MNLTIKNWLLGQVAQDLITLFDTDNKGLDQQEWNPNKKLTRAHAWIAQHGNIAERYMVRRAEKAYKARRVLAQAAVVHENLLAIIMGVKDKDDEEGQYASQQLAHSIAATKNQMAANVYGGVFNTGGASGLMNSQLAQGGGGGGSYTLQQYAQGFSTTVAPNDPNK